MTRKHDSSSRRRLPIVVAFFAAAWGQSSAALAEIHSSATAGAPQTPAVNQNANNRGNAEETGKVGVFTGFALDMVGYVLFATGLAIAGQDDAAETGKLRTGLSVALGGSLVMGVGGLIQQISIQRRYSAMRAQGYIVEPPRWTSTVIVLGLLGGAVAADGKASGVPTVLLGLTAGIVEVVALQTRLEWYGTSREAPGHGSRTVSILMASPALIPNGRGEHDLGLGLVGTF